ncbi:MAG: hypothetical protein DPW09_24185, partial [Anaerolineae bacterium]|nr:hypothetical protein [Anaerolineae bacterium]
MKTGLNSAFNKAAILRRIGEVLSLATLLAFSAAVWQHVVHYYIHTISSDSLMAHLPYIAGDSVLAFWPALVAVIVGSWLAARLNHPHETRPDEIAPSGWVHLFQRAALISIFFMLLIIPLAWLGTFINDMLGITYPLLHSHISTEPLGGVLDSMRNAFVSQVISLPLLLVSLAALARRHGEQTDRPRPLPVSWLRRLAALPIMGICALLMTGVIGWQAVMAAGWAASPQLVPTAFNNACANGGTVRSYNVSAIPVNITLNRFGDHDPGSFMYVLDENIAAVRAQEASRQVSIGLRKDPIQPLAIRVNMGECLEIRFTNRLSFETSFHIQGLPYDVSSAAGRVGQNANSFAAPNQSITYRWPIPTEIEAEGAYYVRPHGASRQVIAHGLFGAVIVEPSGAQYLDPETGAPLTGSNWEAIIVDPNGPDFREFVLIYHEVGDEDFRPLDAGGDKLPRIDPNTDSYRPASRAINYRSEPFGNRLRLLGNNFSEKSLSYSSYMFGDPATPMPRSYLGEPTKTRLMHGGSEMAHVHHLHGGGDRWPENPRAGTNIFAIGLQKLPPASTSSNRLDSQAIDPGSSFNLEHECGAGGCQQIVGDYLFHCHIGHHYVSGMWSFWRVFDTEQPDLAYLPDRSPVPQAVNSLGLIGQVVEGKTFVPRVNLTDPDTQLAVEDWVENKLPPQGVPLDAEDATVWNWQLVYVNGDQTQPLYFGEPETTRVWPNYTSPTPGQRPEIRFNPTNGRYAWPLLRPHLGQRPPFSGNGHTGAPWAGEDATASRPDGMCPTSAPNHRYYPITAIDLPIRVTDERVDDNGMLFVLTEDKAAVRSGAKPAQPLAIRSNVGDCVQILFTSEQEDDNHGGHAKVNMHTHFVQFDPQASDGVITGLSYEQSIRPYASENRIMTVASAPGATSVTVTHVNRLRVGIFIGVGLGDPEAEVRRITAINGTTLTFDQPLESAHPAGAAVGVEFMRYRWYSDVDSGTIFWHDHVDFKTWSHGLFSVHIIEPAGSTYHDPQTGVEVRSGTVVDIHTNGSAGAGQTGSFREFVVFLHNTNPATGEEAGSTINLRAEPFDRRGGDPSLLFSSVKHGDPLTPVFRAYVGDPVMFRGMGVVERMGAFRVTGHRFYEERFTTDSALIDTMSIDISEREDVLLDGGAGGPLGLPGDYLYYSTIARDFAGGAWGIMRVHDTVRSDLRPLPGHTPPGGSGFPQQTFTGGNPVKSTDPGNVCPGSAAVRSYNVSIFRQPIPFQTSSGSGPGTDSNGVIYALTELEQDIVEGLIRPYPLVLRVNVGECLEINLTNHLSERASINLGKLLFDPQGSYGAAVGFNADSTVGPGEKRLYRFYADKMLDTNIMLDLADPELGARGAFGAVIVEPEGAVWRNYGAGTIIEGETHADIILPNGEAFREYVALIQDEDPRIGQSIMPYPVDVEGFAGINYTAHPLAERLDVDPNRANVFNSQVHGDPLTLDEAYVGDAMIYRYAQPWGEQDHIMAVEGHRWPAEPTLPGASQIGAQAILPGETFDAVIRDGAGSGMTGGGDYLYVDLRQPFQEAGMWGIMRTHALSQTNLLRLPTSGEAVAPVPGNDRIITSTAVMTLNVASNDKDADGTVEPASVAIVTQPLSGTITNNGDGSVTYRRNPGISGRDSFQYTIADNDGLVSLPATVFINLPGLGGGAPLARNDAATTGINMPVNINILANDVDLDGLIDPATLTIVDTPDHGGLAILVDHTVTYTPTTAFTGTDTFAYTVADDMGLVSNVATATITVNGGAITIIKEANDNVTAFNFTFNGAPFSAPLKNGESAVFDGLTTGVYTVTEIIVPGWEVAGISCTNGIELGALAHLNEVAINLTAGQRVTCTFTNAKIPPPPPLTTIPVPEPPNLFEYVKDKQAAIELGKALFWDMQVGSDNQMACASCHFGAGADNRLTNQINPGVNGVFEVGRPNYTLQPEDFPFYKLADPFDRNSTVLRDSDDRGSSSGVFQTNFNDVDPNSGEDNCDDVFDTVFHTGDSTVRRVEPRNAPTAINAVFNHRNFWDGRANFVFNGVSPFGPHDPNAYIYVIQNGLVVTQTARIPFASLASQAVGPPGSAFEMSCGNRPFAKIGQKLIHRRPLALQEVHPQDSVLGDLAHPSGQGLATTYEEMVKAAFLDKYWDSGETVNGHSVMEANFSLFFGLAVQLYEATLVSDQTPYDKFAAGDQNALTAQQQRGLQVFLGEGKCIACHKGAEFTGATVSNIKSQTEGEGQIEAMVMGDGLPAIYDNGFYNVGVTRTEDDLGVGSQDPFGNPLSFSRQCSSGNNVDSINCPILSNPNQRVAVDGAFKTPTLRNVELTAPYFHNGSMATLEQVVEFYIRGGNFHEHNLDNLDPDITILPLSPDDRAALVAFLKALTDDRVRNEKAPFDHPQLLLTNGQEGDDIAVNDDGDGEAVDEVLELPATGVDGGLKLEPYILIHPQVEVIKRVDKPQIEPGETVTFTIAAKNTGDTRLEKVSVSDSLPSCALAGPSGDGWADNVLDVGETWTYTCSVTLLEDAQSTASVTAQDKLKHPVGGSGSTFVDVVDPDIDIVKTASASQVQAGDIVTYTYEVSTFGSSDPLINISVVDDKCAPVTYAGGDAYNIGVLEFSEIWLYTCSTTLTQDTLNTARVVGYTPSGAQLTWSDTAFVKVDASNSAITLQKTAYPISLRAGEQASYTYLVSNPGSEVLSNIILSDDKCSPVSFDLGDGNSNNSLDPGETWRYSCRAVLTEDTLNTAVVTATNSFNSVVQDQDTAFVEVTPIHPAIQVAKTASPTSAYAGSPITYMYYVTNPGDDPLSQIRVTDDKCSSISSIFDGDLDDDHRLDPGETWTYTCNMLLYEDTVNLATATGLSSLHQEVIDTATAAVTILRPQLLLEKEAAEPVIYWGDEASYTYRVVNTGNDPLTGIEVTDDKCTEVNLADDGNGNSVLEPDESWRYTCRTRLTSDTTNTAAATGSDSNSHPVRSNTATATVEVVDPNIDIFKTASATEVAAGEVVTYTYEVSLFMGDDPLTDISVVDDKCAPLTYVDGDDGDEILERREVWEYTCSAALFTDTVNTALVSGVDVLGNSTDWDDSVLVKVIGAPSPALTLTKTASQTVIYKGDEATYTYQVSNTGNDPLTEVVLSDDKCTGVTQLGGDANLIGVLEAGEIWEYICRTPLSQDTLNTATASARSSSLNVTLTATATATVDVIDPDIDILKKASRPAVAEGEEVSYTYEVSLFTSDDPLSNITVVDDKCAPVTYMAGDTNADEILDTTELWKYSCSTALYTDTLNTALVTGVDALGNQVDWDDSAFVKVIVDQYTPALTLNKTADAVSIFSGQQASYTYELRNTGNDPLKSVVVADDKCAPVAYVTGDADTDEMLDLNERWTYTCSTALTESTTNTGTARAIGLHGGLVEANDTAYVEVITLHPAIQIEKTAYPTTAYAGSAVSYLYYVSNPGDDPLGQINVADDKCQVVNSVYDGDLDDDHLLDPGEVWTFTCTMLLYEDTTNIATVSGMSSLNNPVTAMDMATVTIINPQLTLRKRAEETMIYLGDEAVYSYEVSNPGNNPLSDVVVEDDQCADVSYVFGDDGDQKLEPGETWKFSCRDTLTQDTLNTAKASAKDTQGRAVHSAVDTAFVEVINPNIDVFKEASATQVAAGEVVTYTYEVSLFASHDPLTDIEVKDDKCADVNYLSGDDNDDVLEFGEKWLYSCSMPLTETTTNLVTASGVDELNHRVEWEDEVTVEVTEHTPALTLVKQADPAISYANEPITFTFQVSNTGNVPLTEVDVLDEQCSPETYTGGDLNTN